MADILNIVLPTFIVVFIGYIFGKIKKDANVSPLIDITFNIGGPAITFVSMLEKKIVLLDAGKIWVSALIIMLGCGIVAWVIFKCLKQKHTALYLPIGIMNTVNLPFPIIYLAYGSAGLFAATLFCIPNILVLYTLGIFIAAGKHWKEGIKEIFRVPMIYAAVLGLILNLMDIKLPAVVMNSLNLVAMMAIPLILIVLGYSLSRVRIASIPTTFLASFLRLGVGLALGFLAVNLLNLEGVFKSVVILDSAMPAAVNTAVVAAKYDQESDLVSSVVFVTTVISVVTIPFLLQLLA
jgi:predicted permease